MKRISPEEGAGPRLCSELPPIEVGNGEKVKVGDIVALVKKACEAVLEVYRQPEGEWNLQHKDGYEPLTKADLDSNKILLEGLESLCPSCLLVSEESAHASHAQRSSADFVWLVDPLDGTKEFLKRSGEFAVNVGLCRRGIPIFGVVGSPVEGLIYLGGEVLRGAWRLQGNSELLYSIKCKIFKWNDLGLKVITSSSHNSTDTKKFIARLQQPSLVKAGSSLKFLRVASGDADIYPRFALCSEWDTCAPHAILRAAGGEVFLWEGAATGGPQGPLKYNKPSLLSPFFVAVGTLAEGEAEAPPHAPVRTQIEESTG